MAGVSVNRAAVVSSIKLCELAAQVYEQAATSLEQDRDEAGSTWRDDKYRRYAGIIDECAGALRDPVRELRECEQTLRQLLKAMDSYEETQL